MTIVSRGVHRPVKPAGRCRARHETISRPGNDRATSARHTTRFTHPFRIEHVAEPAGTLPGPDLDRVDQGVQ
jgi:hypothetical protein